MAATDAQVRVIMNERIQGKTQQQAAVSANLKSRKTVAKYEKLNKLPSQLKQPRQYRTRPDPFADVWSEVVPKLEQSPHLEAKALFEWLCEQHPDCFCPNQLRTFQRRVSDWKALHQEKLACLPQAHPPGEVLQTDGTWLSELGITLQGHPFEHLLIHSVLPYSNWEWGRVAQSESLSALHLGLSSCLLKLGHVPVYHQTDNSSAATFWTGKREAKQGESKENSQRAYSQKYLDVLNHYGLQARRTHVSSPQENGDVESSNGSLKRAIEQQLSLRSSRDFDSLSAYEAFLFDLFERRNQPRQQQLAEELVHMKPWKGKPLPTSRQVRPKVSRGSLIRVEKNTYSVRTSLIGLRVVVHIHEWHLEVYYHQKRVETIPRLLGKGQHYVNYRHVIDSLLSKPGGFRHYRYRDDLFPCLVFRKAWERLDAWHAPRKADLSYLRILKLAARHLESEVATALQCLLGQDKRWDETDVERLIQPQAISVPKLQAAQVQLNLYDRLIPKSLPQQEKPASGEPLEESLLSAQAGDVAQQPGLAAEEVAHVE